MLTTKHIVNTKEADEVLARFGLNEKDRAVYLALLPLGQSTLTPLARAAGFPSTTAQSVLERLERLGLVAVTKRKSRRAYEALDPVVLRRILERQAEEAAGIIPQLQELMRGASASAADVRVYRRERLTDLFHRALRSREKLVYEIVSARDLQETLGEKFHFTRRRVRAGVGLKSLRVEAHEIKSYSAETHRRELREARFLPREMAFSSTVMFWDGEWAAFFAPPAEGLALLVRSRGIVLMLRQIFDVLWSVSRRMETAA